MLKFIKKFIADSYEENKTYTIAGLIASSGVIVALASALLRDILGALFVLKVLMSLSLAVIVVGLLIALFYAMN